MPWSAIALVVAVFVLAGLLIVWLRESHEPMEDEHQEPGIRHGMFWASAYVAFAVALYSSVVWGWLWLKANIPGKFWSVS